MVSCSAVVHLRVYASALNVQGYIPHLIQWPTLHQCLVELEDDWSWRTLLARSLTEPNKPFETVIREYIYTLCCQVGWTKTKELTTMHCCFCILLHCWNVSQLRLSLGFSFAAVAAVFHGSLEVEQTKLFVDNIINQLTGSVFPALSLHACLGGFVWFGLLMLRIAWLWLSTKN